jgi:hypothetical protein
MAKSTGLEVYYGTTRTPFSTGRLFRNPQGWSGKIEADAKRVYVVGDHPAILSAYGNAGIPVQRIDPSDPRLKDAKASFPAPKPGVAAAAPGLTPLAKAEPSDEKRSAVVIPSDWASMPWADLRKLAASLSSKPVTNRGVADKVIIDEIERRK